ncbi:uncharacterized protein EDB91DRAFT_1198475 [Suillus paluster]|uniref:uncharacterized protein n=1 Tax=Suillus paluster TaxID=48578 RepID=UPI001B8758B0|nr:uncharacterized protein EDB91DRAFT_1198475 [Suillus paluster]KAG1747960.1 hypothetical protein EDB91DRAFT_1198475 [Suillus paluster]
MGNVRQRRQLDPFTARQLHRSNVRHCISLQDHTCTPQSTMGSVHSLARLSIHQQSPHVRTELQCRSIQLGSRHARRHLQESRIWSNSKVGGRLLRHPPTAPRLDRGRIHRPVVRFWGSMELGEAASLHSSTMLHQLQLGPLLQAWLTKGARFTTIEAASLHGKLVHISSIFPLIRPFLRSIALFANKFKLQRAHPETSRPPLVGRREYFLRNRCSGRLTLGSMEMERGLPSRLRTRAQHRLGRSHSRGTGSEAHYPPWLT